MSERMNRRLDTIITYGRLVALIGVFIITFLTSSEPKISRGLILLMVVVMAIVDAFAAALFYFKLYSDYITLVFLVLSCVFALALLHLGGPDMFFYAFVPAVALSIRFDWTIGLGGAGVLAIGHFVILLINNDLRNVEPHLVPALFQALLLIGIAPFCGLLAENIKKEPPLNESEVKERNQEMQHLKMSADRAYVIYEMAGMLSATLNSQKILRAVLEVSSVGFNELNTSSDIKGSPAGAVFLYDAGGLSVASSRNISPEETELMIDGEKGVVEQVLNKGKPLLLGNLANDPELKQFSPFRRCRSAICAPLRAGFNVFGIVLFASPQPEAFNQEHVDLLTAVANQAAVALANAQLYQDLQDEKERIIAVDEAARTKLARDLHDGPTQSISAIAMRLNFTRLLLDRDLGKAKDELFKLENLARRTTKEIRTMLFTLRPLVLETQGLGAAVKQFVKKLKEADNLPLLLELEDVEEHIDINIQSVAWCIIEESVTNAKKHARAKHIWIRIYIKGEYFVTEIQDDGKGFDFDSTMATYDQRGSLGLLNLQERADLVNGKTTIQSVEDKGTKITLVVPLSREAV